VATVGTWAQSTWRGQAEVWTAKNIPTAGFVAASNQFPVNSLLIVENYKTRKSIQVRVVSVLPPGSTDLVLLSPKAAQALEIKSGEVPLVGVQIDPTGIDRPDNPDPDVNPLAAASAAPAPASSPSLLPLPPVAPAPDTGGARTPLAVADEPAVAPATPGKKVFQTTKNPSSLDLPLAVAVPAAPNDSLVQAPIPDQSTAPVDPSAAPVTAVADASAAVNPVAPVLVKPAPASVWVSSPGKIEGPILGQVPVLAALDKGKPYVQLGSWATEADVLATLGSVKSYVPLALYKAEGQKNPWRAVASAPKGQLGVLLMLFRSQGLRTAAVVKG